MQSGSHWEMVYDQKHLNSPFPHPGTCVESLWGSLLLVSASLLAISPEKPPVQHQCCVVLSNTTPLQREDRTANWAKEKPLLDFFGHLEVFSCLRWVDQRALLPYSAPNALLWGIGLADLLRCLPSPNILRFCEKLLLFVYF